MTSCHAVTAMTGVPSAQRLASTPESEASSIEADAAPIPHQSSRPEPAPTTSRTPPIPSSAPSAMRRVGRSDTSAQAKPASATGVSAWTEEATLEGSSWAAR